MTSPEARDEQAPRESFEAFAGARLPALVRTAYLLAGDHHAAEELAQVALMKAVPGWRRIAHDPEPHVRAILAREYVSRRHRRRWHGRTAGRSPQQAVATHEQGADLALWEALRRLPPRQRAVVVLRSFDALTASETAAALGIAVGTVRSQHRDALARLRLDLPGLALEEDEPVRRTVAP